MSYSDFLSKLERLELHVKNEKTGTAEDLADKLGISRRALFNYLAILRDKGSKIDFCKIRKTYFFDN